MYITDDYGRSFYIDSRTLQSLYPGLYRPFQGATFAPVPTPAAPAAAVSTPVAPAAPAAVPTPVAPAAPAAVPTPVAPAAPAAAVPTPVAPVAPAAPAAAVPTPDWNSVMQEIAALKNMVQAQAVTNTQIGVTGLPQVPVSYGGTQTADDILASIINPPEITTGNN